MATYRHRGKRWQAVVRVARHNPEYKTFDTKKEATDWAKQRELDLDSSVASGSQSGREALRAPFHALLRRYKKEVIPVEMAPITQRVETYRINRLLSKNDKGRYRYPIVNLLTIEITANAVRQFIKQRLEDDKVKPQTLRLDIARMGHCITTAIRVWDVPLGQNPFYIPKLPKPTGTNPVKRVPPKTVELILKTAKEGPHSDAFVPTIQLALHTGIRGIELRRLTWDDVDLTNGFIRLPAHKTKNGEYRSVPLDEKALEALNQLKALDRGDSVIPLTRNQMSNAWQEMKKKSGVSTRFHDLRHEFVSRCRDKKIPSYFVMKMTGHKSEEMLNNYSHEDELMLKELLTGVKS